MELVPEFIVYILEVKFDGCFRFTAHAYFILSPRSQNA
jgi:hypothetical protein